ncbi:MAG TPA: hypothetical protein VK489_13275 [Ferruginibacter sp.]|nr:hypothetical protein [Ferruginibacter sp.]
MSSPSSLIPGISHFIPLPQAVEMTARYREDKERILVPEMRGKNILPVCETFNRDAFDLLLNEGGCVGLRLYFSMGVDLKIRIIAVGVNSKNEDMLPPGG